MSKNITKEFEGNTWHECISKVVKFLMDYNLDFQNLQMRKENTTYVGVLTYGLGIQR